MVMHSIWYKVIYGSSTECRIECPTNTNLKMRSPVGNQTCCLMNKSMLSHRLWLVLLFRMEM